MTATQPFIVRRDGTVLDRASEEVIGRIERNSYSDAPDDYFVFNNEGRRIGTRSLRRNALRLLWESKAR